MTSWGFGLQSAISKLIFIVDGDVKTGFAFQHPHTAPLGLWKRCRLYYSDCGEDARSFKESGLRRIRGLQACWGSKYRAYKGSIFRATSARRSFHPLGTDCSGYETSLSLPFTLCKGFAATLNMAWRRGS